MKCERCEFAPAPDSEGYQDECGLFDEYGTVWKDGSYGCTMNYQTLRKLDEDHMESLGNMGEDMGTEMDFENRGWKMEDAIRNMKHMIGMFPEGLRKPYNRHGKTFYRPYRNYWYGENKYLDYFSGVLGIVEKKEPADNEKHPWYRLTDHGLKYLGRHINVTIHPEED